MEAMIALTTPATPAVLTQAFTAIAAAAAHIGRRLVEAWRHRHDATALAALDDRMLADIGLTRADLNDALSEPLWRDPTSVLVRRKDERRWARRAAVAQLIGQTSPSIVPGTDAFAYPPGDPPARLTM
jgi:uncharacterized protein YjiS (DUF1127 family)